jgi:hypothetical protein
MQRQREERERAIQQPRNLVFPPEATNSLYLPPKKRTLGSSKIKSKITTITVLQ